MLRSLFVCLMFSTALSYGQTVGTVAGNGIAGFSGDGGPATLASLNEPNGVVFDKHGNMYIADCGNERIRKVNTSGIISTVAGNGSGVHSGDGGPATSAGILYLESIAIDDSGNLFISEVAYIRKISTSGIITTIAGDGIGSYNGDGLLAVNARVNFPYVNCVDTDGSLLFSDYGNHRVRKIDRNGIITTVAGNGQMDIPGMVGLRLMLN